MRSKRGFTLIELMVVVAIVAVLAMIALPTFTEYLRKGKRAEAISAIGDVQLREERYRADYPTYGNTTATTEALGNLFGSTTAVSSYNGNLKYYDISVSGNSSTGYTVTATRKGDLANDPKCANFTMTVTAGTPTKGMSDGNNVDYCWRQK